MNWSERTRETVKKIEDSSSEEDEPVRKKNKGNRKKSKYSRFVRKGQEWERKEVEKEGCRKEKGR